MRKYRKITLLFFVFVFLSSCSFLSSEEPNYILTAVAGTQIAAAQQTERAKAFIADTPTLATLRPTITAQPTGTTYVFASLTPKPSATPTKTPRIRTTWPDWTKGDVVTMPRGSGQNIGTNKKFSDLTGLKVMVVRRNGVVLHSSPNKAIGGPMEERGSAFTLTGVMNKNPQFAWLFAQVIAADGKTYWVGGSEGDENTDPRVSLIFYYPKLTPPSPTTSLSLTPTILSLTSTPTPSATLSPTPFATFTLNP